ncbi:MAG: hypothetical protein ACTHL3_03165, partial [Candidatus Nitrosocosmicus sp.]
MSKNKDSPSSNTIESDIKSKTEFDTITFRLEKYLLDKLRQESEHTGISINTMVNQIIKSHLQWHKPAKTASLGYFSKVLFSKMIDKLTEQQLIKTTEEFCKDNLLDICYMLGTEHDFSSFMDAFCNWIDASGFRYKIDKGDELIEDIYAIQFDMGRNWSLYMVTMMKFVFDHYDV